MKKTIVLMLLLWGVMHCRNRAENAPRLDAGRLTELNRQLSEKALAPRVLVNKSKSVARTGSRRSAAT
jgi:hypothetical protein